MYVVSLTNGKKFQSEPGETLLSAAMRHSIIFNYSCSNGRCGSCKCKVVSGNTSCIKSEIGLTDREKADGQILSCVRIAESDVFLDAEDIGPVDLPKAKITPCRIEKIKALSTNILEITLRLPPTTKFWFLPGQYIDIIGPSGERRSYSIASAPNTDNNITLHIGRVNNGILSDYWFNRAKCNDLLRLNGPLGTFFLRDTSKTDLIFLATGTGIAPVKSILESLIAQRTDLAPRSISVFWGGRVQDDLYFDLSDIPLNFKFTPVLSRASIDWSGYRGYVQQALLDSHPNLRDAAVYACGSFNMVCSAQVTLTSAGLPDNRFYSDAFVHSGNNKS